jgi:hypothetical protein
MTPSPTQRVDRALLIGVDHYQYIAPPLNGCVGDVDQLEQFLIDRLHTPPGQIIKLTASHSTREKAEELATRDNIVNAFRQLAGLAQPGEQIYIHYSGHGMRNDTTILPGYEADGKDEAIAPTDTGYQDPARPYLLDKELGWLIHQISVRKAFVTMVLDCCHSASGTRVVSLVNVRRGQRRAEDIGVGRGWEGGDPRPRPDSTLVAPLAQLKELVAGAGGTGSLLPAPEGYVLLTACREQETAKEYGSNGVFTYYLLELLGKGTAGLTYRSVQDYVSSSILQLASGNAGYQDQTPQLEGNGNLVLFGGGSVAQPQALLATPQADGSLLLSGGGAAVGMTTGSTVALYPPGTVDLTDTAGQLGLATVTEVRPDVAIARAEGVPAGQLSAGMRAVLLRPGIIKIRRRVALGTSSDLNELRDAITTNPRTSAYVELVAPGDQQEYSVVIREGAYAILDQRDQPLPRITPPLLPGQNEAARKANAQQMTQRLEHVVQYRNAWELRNEDETSGLRGLLGISIQLAGASGRSAGRVELRPGDDLTIRVHNRSQRPLSAALFYFAPNWSVARIWPDGSAPAYTELAPTGPEGFAVFEMSAMLPPGIGQSTERLKLFATEKPTSFDVLMLDSLDVARSAARSLGNPLEELLANVAEGSASRELIRRKRATGDWSTAELELDTVGLPTPPG